MAFSAGDGGYETRSWSHSEFTGGLGDIKADTVVGDFNGDGKDDVALLGGTNWNSVLIARSTSFREPAPPDPGTPPATGVVNPPIPTGAPVAQFTPTHWFNPAFANLAANPSAKPVAGDFNGDGRDDLALVGLPHSLPVALSTGTSFTNTPYPVQPVSWFISLVHTPGAQVAAADFNGEPPPAARSPARRSSPDSPSPTNPAASPNAPTTSKHP